jgi:hypothetical protein
MIIMIQYVWDEGINPFGATSHFGADSEVLEHPVRTVASFMSEVPFAVEQWEPWRWLMIVARRKSKTCPFFYWMNYSHTQNLFEHGGLYT